MVGLKSQGSDVGATHHAWAPVSPLTDVERHIDLADIKPLYESWRLAKQRLSTSSPANLDAFLGRLVRRMSIETGILERLYDLDRGTTEALVAHGFAEELVSRSSTDIEPSRLIDILRDQEAAVKIVMDCVARKRPLTKTVVHELHAILTRHQDTTTAVDQFGNRLEIPLLKGSYKRQPNNPRRPDGSTHEYCPPVHVDSEMDNLLNWLNEYGEDDPLIVSSWLHHSFTQIHPYQDGNGRVGRALITLVLLRADLLPLVIDRDLRVEYIKALEAADAGDLTTLAHVFARLERNAILQALSIDADVDISRERSLSSAVIEGLAVRLAKRKEAKYAELRRVNGLAEKLRGKTRRTIERAIAELNKVAELDDPDVHITEGGPDRANAHWYRFDVIRSGQTTNTYVNFEEAHYFHKASIRLDRERLIFVVSFHHVGRELSGVMETTAFARLESYEASEDREYVTQDFFLCSLEPFVITWKTSEEAVSDAFERWLDAALAVALKEFGDRL
ncbi:MAG: Fic family protein [Nitrospiraceae bacterium]